MYLVFWVSTSSPVQSKVLTNKMQKQQQRFQLLNKMDLEAVEKRNQSIRKTQMPRYKNGQFTKQSEKMDRDEKHPSRLQQRNAS